MNATRNSMTILIILSLVVIRVTPGICEGLKSLHERRIPVEFISDGKFDAVGSIEFHLPSSSFGLANKHDGKIIYIYFIQNGEGQVSPFVHIMDLTTIEMVDKDIVAFSGESDYGFPFSGNITSYSPMQNTNYRPIGIGRLSLSIHARGVLEIRNLMSEEAKAFKAKYIDKVNLGY